MHGLWAAARRALKALVAASVFVSVLVITPSVWAQSTGNLESKAHGLVSASRSQAGKATLSRNTELDEIARAHSKRMADRDAIYHNPNLKTEADAAGVTWIWIGENVGVGVGVEQVHEGFMASSGHRENIVHSEYNVVGIGAVVGGDGSVFVTQAFARVEQEAPKTSQPASTKPPAERVDQHTTEQPDPAAAPTPTLQNEASKAPEQPSIVETQVASAETESVDTGPSHLPNALVDGEVT